MSTEKVSTLYHMVFSIIVTGGDLFDPNHYQIYLPPHVLYPKGVVKKNVSVRNINKKIYSGRWGSSLPGLHMLDLPLGPPLT